MINVQDVLYIRYNVQLDTISMQCVSFEIVVWYDIINIWPTGIIPTFLLLGLYISVLQRRMFS